jgi:hypothetical protein
VVLKGKIGPVQKGKDEKSLPNFVLGVQSQNFRSVSNLSRYQENAWQGALIGDQFSQRRSFVDTNVQTQRKSAPRDPEEENQHELSTSVSVFYLVPIWFVSGLILVGYVSLYKYPLALYYNTFPCQKSMAAATSGGPGLCLLLKICCNRFCTHLRLHIPVMHPLPTYQDYT